MYFFNQNLYNNFENYNISVLIFNVLVYLLILTNIFIILLLFDLKYLKNLNELKLLNNLSVFNVFFVLLFLSFAGTPPLLGFLSKFLIFVVVFYKQNYFIFLLFIILNFFSMYFYLQNLRFLVSKKSNNILICNNNIVSFSNTILYFFNILNFFNILGIVYFEDFFILLNFFSSNLNF